MTRRQSTSGESKGAGRFRRSLAATLMALPLSCAPNTVRTFVKHSVRHFIAETGEHMLAILGADHFEEGIKHLHDERANADRDHGGAVAKAPPPAPSGMTPEAAAKPPDRVGSTPSLAMKPLVASAGPDPVTAAKVGGAKGDGRKGTATPAPRASVETAGQIFGAVVLSGFTEADVAKSRDAIEARAGMCSTTLDRTVAIEERLAPNTGFPSLLAFFADGTSIDDARKIRRCFAELADTLEHIPVVRQDRYLQTARTPPALSDTGDDGPSVGTSQDGICDRDVLPLSGTKVRIADWPGCLSCKTAVVVHEEPRVEAQQVASLVRGDAAKLLVLDTHSDPVNGSWVKVKVDRHRSGWVYARNTASVPG